MRRDEEFVGLALVEFLGGPSCASASDGEDPPDLYLTIGASHVGVEVTRLSQFTFEHGGILGNRTTQDCRDWRGDDALQAPSRAGSALGEQFSWLRIRANQD
jgi:hypothetical protein